MAGYSEDWIHMVQTFKTSSISEAKPIYQTDLSDTPKSPKLHVIASREIESKPMVTFRQVSPFFASLCRDISSSQHYLGG